MMKTFVKTLIGGALGAAALYAVGKIAFQAGRDIAEAEHAYENARQRAANKEQETAAQDDEESGAEESTEAPVPAKKQSRIGMALGLWKALKKKETSAIGDLLQNPENHVIEACIKGREIHVNVKPRTA